jgi:hypothetical protein
LLPIAVVQFVHGAHFNSPNAVRLLFGRCNCTRWLLIDCKLCRGRGASVVGNITSGGTLTDNWTRGVWRAQRSCRNPQIIEPGAFTRLG